MLPESVERPASVVSLTNLRSCVRNWQQHSVQRTVLFALVSIAVFSLVSSNASALGHEPASSLPTIVKKVVLDPTMYAPAAIAYDATVRDWNTSQPFFRNGFMEQNPHFTISGLPDDVPVSYSEGRRRILVDTVSNLGPSIFNNFTDRLLERALIARYPDHRKMVRTVSWIERLSFSVCMSYVLSAQHYRQAQSNTLLAQGLGYR